MPNRMLRDWTDSEKVELLSFQAEVFFVRLIMKVDDFGCYRANEKLLKSKLFPLRDNIRDTDILRWVDECHKAGLIAVYEESGKRYLIIKDFKQRKRQMESKHPMPKNDGQLSDTCQTDVGLKRREEEVEEKGNKLHKNAFVVYNAEDEILKSPIELERICMTTGHEMPVAKEILRRYHLYLEEKEQYPKGKKAVFSGFERWLLREKKFNNGTHQQTSGSSKPGTADDQNNAVLKW